jgi:hypothetical protein
MTITLSITPHQSHSLYSSDLTAEKNSQHSSNINFNEYMTDNVTNENNISQLRPAGYMTNINRADIDVLYSEIKSAAAAELDANNINNEELGSFDYLNATINKLAN